MGSSHPAKDDIRKRMRAVRKSMSAEEIREKSETAVRRLLDSELYRSASSIWCYVALPREVQTLSLLCAAQRDGKKTAVPKVEGAEICFYPFRDIGELREGSMHILEPRGGERAEDPDALLILPGLAFDCAGNRIGYGGGYYDRFLRAHPSHRTAALSFDFAVLDAVPHEPSDVPVELVVTESRCLGSPSLLA